jgi:hypothetical protein
MPEQELTRRSLYDLVWSRPMTKVADDLGISDVALKKICDRHRVPTPARGYPPYEGLPEASGRLLYCKLSLTGDENLDLLSRKRATGEFPYHSTLNQNYDELLFNAYRILGSHIVGRVVSGQDRVELSNGELRSLTVAEVQNLFS